MTHLHPNLLAVSMNKLANLYEHQQNLNYQSVSPHLSEMK